MSWGAAARRQALRAAGRTRQQAGTEPRASLRAPCGEDGPSQLHKAALAALPAPARSCRGLRAACMPHSSPREPEHLLPSPHPVPHQGRGSPRTGWAAELRCSQCRGHSLHGSCPLPPPHGGGEALAGYTPPAMPDTMEATPEAGAPRRPSMVRLDWLFRRCFSSTFSDSSWSMSA